MTSEYLILGATDGIGHAFSWLLMRKGIPLTMLVTNPDKVPVVFRQNGRIEIIEGDAGEPSLLKKVAQDKKFIFLGNDTTWGGWQKQAVTYVQNIINATSGRQATLIYPGTVLQFGGDVPITERTAPRPSSVRAALEVKLEDMMLDAVVEEKCRVIIIRHAELYGPGVINGDISQVFINALNKKTSSYPVNLDIPRQFAYTRDLAEIIFRLLELQGRGFFSVFNYAGETYASARSFLNEVCSLAGSDAAVRVLRKERIKVLSLFRDSWKELNRKVSFYERSYLLDDTNTMKLLPDFRPTSSREAITETLQWFRDNDWND
jgi:nucleoside-diphosphate-sugar epimerase